MVEAMPRWLRMPTPQAMETLAMSRSPVTASAPISPGGTRITMARSIVDARHGEGHVGEFAVSRVFWMIMSTRMPASEMGRKILAAMPGWSGTVLMVMRASFLL